jgi:hypothetical protein
MKEISSITATLASGEASLYDNWIPPAEVHQLVLEGGYDPGEVAEEMADWYSRRVTAESNAA